MSIANERVEAALDDALSMTFPASDPIAPFMALAARAQHAPPETASDGRHAAEAVGARAS